MRVNQAYGAMPLRFAVMSSVARVAQVRPPPSETVNRTFFPDDGLRTDRALDDVAVALDAAVGNEAFQLAEFACLAVSRTQAG